MDIDIIREYITYDRDTGTLTYRKSGKVCKSVDRDGYINVKVKGKRIGAHRVIWMLEHDTQIPAGMQVDHINRVITDNHIDNLRLATASQQNANKLSRGIGRKQGKWRAQTKLNGKHIHIGLYDCPLIAHVKYVDKMREIHGEYAGR